MKIGYTAGVFDLFHIGHINILRSARALCDHLVVGVTTDELVSYKGTNPVIPFEERIEVVRACRYVDVAIPQTSIDKFAAWERLKFDILFVGDDWFRDDTWRTYEEKLMEVDVPVVYLPYTKGISSTTLKRLLTKVETG